MRSIRKRLLFPAMLIFFVVMAIVTLIATEIYDHFYGMHLVKASTYTPELEEENQYNIVYNAEYYSVAVKFNGDLYLEMEFINDTWGNELFFYAEDVNNVYYTSQTEMLEYNVGNGDFIVEDGVVYMKAAFATEVLGTQFTLNEEDRLVMVRKVKNNVANIEKFHTYLRQTPDMEDRHYTKEMNRNDLVEVYGEEINGFYLVVSLDGYMGYVQADRLTIYEEVLSSKEKDVYVQDEDVLFSHTISMAYQQLTDNGLDEDGTVRSSIEDQVDDTYYYLNGLAPTMFWLNEDGSLHSELTPEYVTWANGEFYDTWIVFTNNFDDDLTYETLSNTAKRQKLVADVLAEIKRCDADGVNVDFEDISERTYPYFIQFLRELSIAVRTNWYCLSVCMPVPSEWTDYYRRDIYNDLCDYVVLMAYDEYWGGSEVAGPVSSQGFVLKGISDSLKDINKEKLVLGMPWYTRIWYGEDYELVDSVACSMEYAQSIIDTYGMEKSFDAASGMNYYEGYDDDGVRIRIWMEDADSVTWRLKIAFDTGLPGIIAWRLGLENWTVWQPYEDLLIGNNF